MILLATLLAAAAAATAAPAPDAVVYSGRVGGGGADIFVRTVTGSPRRLAGPGRYATQPAWSPDRRRVAFLSDRTGPIDVYTVRADGTGLRRLTRTAARERDVTWSPDGRRLVFGSDRDGGESEIYTMRADGTGVRRLTRTRRWVMDVHPQFSPDGRSIVFASNRVAYSNLEIFRMRARDGRRLKRLTHFGTGGDGSPGDDVMPEFSPDGTRIAFVSDRSGSHQIWTMDAAGGDLRRITGHARRAAYFPRWSRDGRRLLYMTARDSDGAARLWTRALDEPRPRQIGRGAEADW